MRNEGGGFAEIDDEVAAVLAFVISHTTFLAAQDDEMRHTTPALPIEPAKTLSQIIKGQHAPGANPSPESFTYSHFLTTFPIFPLDGGGS